MRGRLRDSRRDKAIVGIAYYAGLRVEEISSLDIDDLIMPARRGKVIIWEGKGHRRWGLDRSYVRWDVTSA